MLSFISKNLQKFLIFFFAATSVVLVIIGITRVKKPSTLAESTLPPTPSPLGDIAGATIIDGAGYQTPWGNAVASITVKDGKIIAVKMPTIPSSPPSVYAEPYLVDQALKAGGANIQGVSGATYTSFAFQASLENAIATAKSQGQSISPNTAVSGVTQTAKPSVPRKYRDDDDEWGEDNNGDDNDDFDDDWDF
ncbi:MAG: FMN-binding protein [Minisyncoccia bacterium]